MEAVRQRPVAEESSRGEYDSLLPSSHLHGREGAQVITPPPSADPSATSAGDFSAGVQGAFITEPESFSWEAEESGDFAENSWISLVEKSITSSIEERETLIGELKQVLDEAVRERSHWQEKVKTMRRFRVPPEPRHWHESVTSALTWRTREVEALRKEIRQLEMKQRAERRDVCQLRARQKRSTAAQSSWCSRSTLHSGFSCSLNSMPSVPSTAATDMRRTNPRAKPTNGLGRDLHVILDHTLGDLGRGKGTPEVRPLGGLCARAHRAGKQVHVWGWEPGDYCFRDETVANASFTLPDVPRLGYREAIFEAQLLHEVMNGMD